MHANGLRQGFLDYFAERGHTVVPSASLVSPDPTVMFTIAGMVPFKAYFVGDEDAPYSRAASVQKCFRTVDIEMVGTTGRHNTFFEMLGNFSFGDYFKAEAIAFAWELLTDRLGIDPDRLWVTVHDSDDEAAALWIDGVGLAPARLQRMGKDNFWDPFTAGPCGPSSEIYFDKGTDHGEAGGPGHGGAERYVEIWNLVFMQYRHEAEGEMVALPSRNIDTGLGLDRLLPVVQGVDSVFETDLLAPVVEAVERVTGHRRAEGDRVESALRVMADHARAMTFLVADGVYPSNEGRGYVLRRVVRRAVLRAQQLGLEEMAVPPLVTAVTDVMAPAYPEVAERRDAVIATLEREEASFRQTLQTGASILDQELSTGAGVLPGDVAFRLHDTYGFPIELTKEVAAERGVSVEMGAFDAEMEAQRARAREASRHGRAAPGSEQSEHRALLDSSGPTEFTGYTETQSDARVLAVLGTGEPGGVEVFLDRTPFYAEAGGQVGDTGSITSETGQMTVSDTIYAAPGLTSHRGRVEGELLVAQKVHAAIDADRRDAIRRNHTGTHLLHWALREVLGDHVKQQGSLVAPDRLRFDFSHFSPLSREEIASIEDLVDERVLANEPVLISEMSRTEADARGAVAFFGDKYGTVVRVVEAGYDSVELCGGTHVSALGMIGPTRIVSEGSIGANTRRIEALTGHASLQRERQTDSALGRVAELLRTGPTDAVDAVERALSRQRQAEEELRELRSRQAAGRSAELASQAVEGVVVARCDGIDQADLRDLAVRVRDHDGIEAVVLIGSPDGRRVALVGAVEPSSRRPPASELIGPAASLVGGGGGRDPELAVAGGRDATRIDEALGQVRGRLGVA